MTPTKPGQYLYRDPIGAPPEPVLVYEVGPDLVVVFKGMAGEDDGEVLVQDIAGDFEPLG